jgi:WD40 repeat protein
MSSLMCRCGRLCQPPETAADTFRCPDCGAVLPAGDGNTVTAMAVVAPEPSTVLDPNLPRVPGYEILGVLGRGGMGVVYRARQIGLKRLVALKMILGGGLAGEAEHARFKAEAEAVARLQHPNIVQVFEVGQAAGLPYFALEFCSGGSLDSRLGGTPLPPVEAARLLQTLARAMHAAHEKGIIHRDLKPANVLIAEDGTPKVTDFGLARKVEASSGMTQSGSVMGTPSYMAPEQAEGKTREAGPPADVYALGAVLYEFLTGRPPFKGVSPMDTLLQVIGQEPVPPTRLQPKTPRDMETVCLKCLEKEPGRRYASAADLADDLGRFLNGEAVRARPTPAWERAWKWARRRPAVAALSLLTLAVAAVGFVLVSWQWLRAEAEAGRARAAEAEAVAAGNREHEQADRERQARKEADERKRQAEEAGERERQQAEKERQARLQADQASAELRELSAYLSLERGLDLCGRGEVGPGLLWLARSLHAAPNAELRHSIQANLGAWKGQVHALQAMLEHPEPLAVVVLSPDGKTVATGCTDGSVRLWDRASGVARLLPARHGKRITALAFSPDGARLASGSADHTAHLWDVAAAAPLGKKMTHRADVFAVTFSPDGATLLTGCRSGAARLWDAASGEPRCPPLEHPGELRAVAFNPTGKTFVTAGGDRQPRGLAVLWDAVTHKQLEPQLTHFDRINAVAYSPDGKHLVTAGMDHRAVLWDAVSGRQVGAELVHQDAILAVAWSSNVIITGGQDRTARLWQGGTGRPIGPPLPHPDWVYCVALSHNGAFALTGGNDGQARIWEVNTGELVGGPMWHPGRVHSVAFGPGDVVLTGTTDRGARLWTRAPRQGPALSLTQGGGEVYAVAVSRDGRRIAAGGQDLAVRVWDGVTYRPIGAPLKPERTNWVFGLAFSPDGGRLAVASRDRLVHVWDVAGGKEALPALRHTAEVAAVAWSADGRLLASAAGDAVQLWQADTGTALGGPLRHPREVKALAFSPDGKWLLTGCSDHQARLWEVPAGLDGPSGKVSAAVAHAGAVLAVAFSPDGKLFLTGSWDHTARLWRTDTQEPVGPPLAHPGEVRSAAFSPDGKWLVTGCSDGGARLWDAVTGLPIGPPLRHRGLVYATAFTADSLAILTGCHDSLVRQWPVPAAAAVDPARAPLWAEVLTGIELGPDRVPRALHPGPWNSRRGRLEQPAKP